jgi:pimeloyl-ACP methyl ester carboxylesterase
MEYVNVITSSIAADAPMGKTRSRRGCLFYVKRGLKWLGIGLFALIVVGVIVQAIATESDRRAYPPIGQLYTVAGHQMHLICTGEGSPTVILEAGGGHFSATWARVQPLVAHSTRVCAYDRAGYGWSEPGPEPRDAQRIASELHTLLNVAGVGPPYVLVGHSLGGIYIRVFNAEYPGEVIGMALIDATHPDNWMRQGESISTLQAVATVSSVLARVGLMRLFFGGQNFDLPERDNAALKADIASAEYWNTQRADAAAMEATTAEGRAAGGLGDLPLAVVAAGEYPAGPGRDIKFSLQHELAALSTNSTYQEIAGANHISLVTDEQYAALVSQAINRVIDAARSGQPLARKQQ